MRNVVLFGIGLKLNSLALELKHMHNEVILYGDRHKQSKKERKIVKQELSASYDDPLNIPVFIICFERVNSLKNLVAWLENHRFKKIVFIDNGSTYPPLLEYLSKTHYQVLPLDRNAGHTAPWTESIVRSLIPGKFYFVTDPDVIPADDCPDNFVQHFLEIHQKFIAYKKVGFGLKIDDLPTHYPLRESVIKWESQFWKHTVADNLYEAGIDTTFALYKPFTYSYMLHPSIRTGGNYVARHMPWYDNPSVVSEEEKFYRFRLDPSVNSWNADELPDRYKKELNS
jgi:hypothetical protein